MKTHTRRRVHIVNAKRTHTTAEPEHVYVSVGPRSSSVGSPPRKQKTF